MLAPLLALLLTAEPSAEHARALEEITVVARRVEPAEVLVLSAHPVAPDALATHPNELLDAAPGAWISRGSGQEHLTAIRSPVLTGAGACGSFLLLENGVPIRPPGFCNVNNFFELWWEGAVTTEVVAGPGSALYGANALHGSINVRTPPPRRGFGSRLLAGSEALRTLLVDAGTQRLAVATALTSSESFRREEGFDQQKLHARYRAEAGGAEVDSWFTATNLNQETAGFILGFEAYRDPDLRRANLNPEAFRDAWAARAASRWRWSTGAWTLEATPFARASRMDFLMHFLPGKPLEENGQDSVGVQLLARHEGPRTWTVGVDLDYGEAFLRQTQDGPVQRDSAFLVATRPPGKQYDFAVDLVTTALYAELRQPLGARWSVTAGLRAERTEYDYDNRMLDGNTRDDGTPCGFGGCLYTRPADRSDSFGDLSPRLTLARTLGPDARAYLRLARGFRPPQATELYRLQSGQAVADLDSVTLDAIELGYRFSGPVASGSLAAFHQEKDNVIFRDADGFNVADGATRHRGVEARLAWRPTDRWRLDLAATWADHEYARGRSPAFGEAFAAGNEVDTAPSTLGRLAVTREALAGGRASLEWVHLGSYFLDAANAHRYPGHELFHASWARRFGPWEVDLRVENLTGERYAERADFAFGNYRYFPGQDRTWLVAVGYRPGES